jgi:hypothetical protein
VAISISFEVSRLQEGCKSKCFCKGVLSIC